jgi:phage-related protein
MKPLKFVGSSLDDIRNFPRDARREAGYQLSQIQMGFEPSDWKPVKGIGPGVREIRIHQGGEYRVIYITALHDILYVLHAFRKKSRKTLKLDLELARTRLKLIQKTQ